MKRTSFLAALAIAIAGPAAAQGVADFYKGKTFTIVAGSSAGGGLDIYGRLLARHVGRHIPGNPTVVVQNMPGAGSLAAARHLYSVAPKDGTQSAIVLPGALLDPLLTGADLKGYDPTKFNYLINANAETISCIVRKDAPVQEFGQLFEKELVVGGTGPGSSLVDYPVVTRNLMGMKLKLIPGYKGSREVSLAVRQNEVQGICGLAWSSAKQQYPEIFDPNSNLKVLVQEDSKPNAEMQKLGAPLSINFAKTPQIRAALEVFYSQGQISRPFILPPGVPEDRVAALRKAFAAALDDGALKADAEKQKLDANPNSGEDVQKLIARIYATPADIVELLRKASAIQ
ncbi:MAG: Bug family tripartite tricarboxylate transporter substrate binding protein [Beijerinckiaceae bacterium]